MEYFDYYLLHNVNSMRYNGIIADCHMFEHMKAWKEAGKIRQLAELITKRQTYYLYSKALAIRKKYSHRLKKASSR